MLIFDKKIERNFMKKIDSDALYKEIVKLDEPINKREILRMIDDAPRVDLCDKHLNGYMFDSLVYRYQLARQEVAKFNAYYNNKRSLEQETMSANRDIMRFIEILDELIGEGNRD